MRLILTCSNVFFPPQSRRFHGLLPKQLLNEHSNHFVIHFNWKLMDWRDLICSGPGSMRWIIWLEYWKCTLLTKLQRDWDLTDTSMGSTAWGNESVLDALSCWKKRSSLDCGVKPNQRGRDRGQAWSNGAITKPVKKLKGHNGFVKEGTDTY